MQELTSFMAGASAIRCSDLPTDLASVEENVEKGTSV